MKSPVFILRIKSALSEEDVKAIQDALDRSYVLGYNEGFEKGKGERPYNPPILPQPTYPTYPNPGYPYITSYATNDINMSNYTNCQHMFVTQENKDKGICGRCGISFADWRWIK